MSNYRNFKLATYFVAEGTCRTTREELEKDLAFFEKHLRLDKVYLEPYRSGVFASEEQVKMCKEVFECHGIRVSGGFTTTMPALPGGKKKQRLFDTFCYNDPDMLSTIAAVAEFNGRHFDEWIIDDFYFTNCTCEACRKGRDDYNRAHGIPDGSWQEYRCHLLAEVSEKYMLAPCKRVNPDCRVIIKYPNWMESYQETGYSPALQKDLFDAVYTGTETRDPFHTDQHLPRYLSFSLMRYMEAFAPGRNGGGWFDPFDCRFLEYYLEQAYLTAFSKPKELMLFCFQALRDTVNVPALGFLLDKLDGLLDELGEVIGVPCYIPEASQGEDNVQDFLGMHGFPIVTTPFFPAEAETMLLTASSACDPDILRKLEPWVAAGGHAVVTSGFMQAMQGRGIERMTSIRCRGRKITSASYSTERPESVRGLNGLAYVSGSREATFPVLEFRNNATWGAICKITRNEESCTLLARDTYGDGELLTLAVPDVFSDIAAMPTAVLSRIRREFRVNGVYLEGEPMTSIFHYDNDTFVLYRYADRDTVDTEVRLHVKGAKGLREVLTGREYTPLYTVGGESVFVGPVSVGHLQGYRILH